MRVPAYEHACRITAPAFSNGQLDPDTTGVTSKNGVRPLVSTALSDVMTVHPDASPAYFRRR